VEQIDRDVMAAAERRLANLARENARLKREANRLREMVQPGRWDRILERAHDDARLILHLRHAGWTVSRRNMEATGLIRQQGYGWAIGLLRYADLEQTSPGSLEALDEALQRLETAAEYLRKHGDDRLVELRVNCSKRYILRRYH